MSETTRRRRSPLLTALFVLLGIFLILLIAGFLLYRYWFHAKLHKPVELSQKESVVLEEKMTALEGDDVRVPGREVVEVSPPVLPGADDPVSPEVVKAKPLPGTTIDDYLNEEDTRTEEEKRRIVLTEREANALLHKNTDLADKVKIKFEKDGIRAALLIPMDEDLPIFGGKTFRGKVLIKAFMKDGKLSLIIDEIIAMGIPIPKAWADFQDVDLVSDPDKANPLIQKIADGIADFRIEDGEMIIQLAE